VATLLDGWHLRVYTQCISEEKSVQTKIQRWGNSLGLRIPRAFAQEAGVGAGSQVDLSVQDGDLVVKPARRKTYRLKELLRKITTKNVPAEVDTGGPVGKEVW
jgi:antitoxin MazE